MHAGSTVEKVANVICGDDAPLIGIECEERQAVELLVRKAQHVQSSEDKSTVLIVVPNRNAKMTVMERMQQLFAPRFSTLRVCTAHEMCQFVLDESAFDDSRHAQVIDDVERKVLFEDMKVLGVKPGRLSALVDFLCKGISEHLERDPEWLIGFEEKAVFKSLRENLIACDAMLACELGSQALFAVEDCGMPKACAADYVLALGYTAFDKSLQMLVQKLAARQLVVTGSVDDCGVHCIPFNRKEGLAELAQASEAKMLHVEDPTWAKARVRAVETESPEKEIEAVAAFLRHVSEEGCGSIKVVAPNKVWLKKLSGAFCKEGLSFSETSPSQACQGDPRKADRGTALQLRGALGLVAHPESVLAWRVWLGLGDWLCMSGFWTQIREAATRNGRSLLEVVSLLASDGAESGIGLVGVQHAKGAVGRLRAGAALLERCKGLSGMDLLRVLEAETGVTDAVAVLGVDEPSPHDSAHLLFRRMHDAALDPLVMALPGVTLALLGDERYTFADCVCFTGMVEGFVPGPTACDDMAAITAQRRALARDRNAFDACMRSACSSAVLSWFSCMDAEGALMLKADVHRICFEEGRRMAKLKPSRFLPNDIDE